MSHSPTPYVHNGNGLIYGQCSGDDGEAPFVADIIADCDGQLRVSPGYRFVNRIDYVLCEVPWTDEDRLQPDYRYD